VLLWSGTQPQFRPIPLQLNQLLPMGREDLGGLPLPDEQVSRAHAQLVHDGRHFQLTDLGSRNGTFLNANRISGTVACDAGAIIRMGRTLLLCCADVRAFASASVTADQGYVVGPTLRVELDRIARYATGGANVLITGENGTGKERAAGAFHRAAAPRGKLVTVNCATLSASTAVSAFFGAMGGVYTQVKEHAGFIEEADGGVLFLDEVGELPLDVQPMLLRAIENGEVTRIGATTPRQVSVRYVSATNRDIRGFIAQGRFREDLFHRLAQQEVRIPSLRERLEEIPQLLHQEMASADRVPDPKLIEEALLRPWPGNVRELINHARGALANAQENTVVRREHLNPAAGQQSAVNRTQPGIRAFSEPLGASPAPPTEVAIPAAKRKPGKDELVKLIQDHGSVAAAARALGEHRNTVNRWREEYGLLKKGEAEEA